MAVAPRQLEKFVEMLQEQAEKWGIALLEFSQNSEGWVPVGLLSIAGDHSTGARKMRLPPLPRTRKSLPLAMSL